VEVAAKRLWLLLLSLLLCLPVFLPSSVSLCCPQWNLYRRGLVCDWAGTGRERKAGPRLESRGCSCTVVVGCRCSGARGGRLLELGAVLQAVGGGGGGEICAEGGSAAEGIATVGGRRKRPISGWRLGGGATHNKRKTAVASPIPHTNTCQTHTRMYTEMIHAVAQLSS
jgi:hypothetical protein